MLLQPISNYRICKPDSLWSTHCENVAPDPRRELILIKWVFRENFEREVLLYLDHLNDVRQNKRMQKVLWEGKVYLIDSKNFRYLQPMKIF